MKLDKAAKLLSEDTKNELLSTGVIGAAGAATSALAHKFMSTGLVKNTAGRAALLGGGLGLLGDYAAVKVNKKISQDTVETKRRGHKMDKVASILLERAAEIRQSSPELVAIEHLKQAGLDDTEARYAVAQDRMEKVAHSELTYKGIDAEEAVRLVKAANINVRELQSFSLVSEEEILADMLEKAAAYIEAKDEEILALTEKVEALEKTASAAPRQEPALPEQITKLAGVGALTFEDIEALKSVPVETLTKVASVIDQPWEMGKAAGVARGTGDPFLDFCLN